MCIIAILVLQTLQHPPPTPQHPPPKPQYLPPKPQYLPPKPQYLPPGPLPHLPITFSVLNKVENLYARGVTKSKVTEYLCRSLRKLDLQVTVEENNNSKVALFYIHSYGDKIDNIIIKEQEQILSNASDKGVEHIIMIALRAGSNAAGKSPFLGHSLHFEGLEKKVLCLHFEVRGELDFRENNDTIEELKTMVLSLSEH